MGHSVTKRRIKSAMQRLRDKASRISVGDLVQLDAEPYDEAAPGPGLYGVTEIDQTFIKVLGNNCWVPVERVQGILYPAPAPDLGRAAA